ASNILNVDIEAAFSRLATTALQGLVVLASDANGLAGTNSTKALTSSVLKHVLDNRPATTTGTGLVQLEDTSSILTSTSVSKVPSTAALKNLIAGQNDRGLVFTATDSQAKSMSSTGRFISCQNLNSLGATTSRMGFVKKSVTTAKSGVENSNYVTQAQVEELIGNAISSFKTQSQIQTLIDAAISAHVSSYHSDGGGDSVGDGGI
ncbi:MAG: hypothetical protein COB29_13965, partial [Sulfitobacter sp.]